MSQTFELLCPETRQMLWVGQGWETMTNFYSEEPETMQKLGRFLEATRGKGLVLVRSDELEKAFLQYGIFEEFEEARETETEARKRLREGG